MALIARKEPPDPDRGESPVVHRSGHPWLQERGTPDGTEPCGFPNVTPQTQSQLVQSRGTRQQRIAAFAAVMGAICFGIANLIGALGIPYLPIPFLLNALATGILALSLISIVWTNHGGSRPFHFFVAGGLFLLAGKVCELSWVEDLLRSNGFEGKAHPIAVAIDTTLTNLGYCTFAWAMALLSVSANRNEHIACLSERQLRLSEERYRRLVELTPNWIFETNRMGTIELTNNAGQSVLGFRSGDLQGRDLFSLADPAHRDVLRASFDEVLAGTQKTELEIRFVNSGGELRWLSLNLVAVASSDGTIEGVQGDGRDITLRRETAETLLRRERHLSFLAEIQASLLGHPGMQGLFERILPRLGQISGASRVSVFEIQKTSEGSSCICKKAEWCAKGISQGTFFLPERSFLWIPPLSRWVDRLRQNQAVSGVVKDLPESERQILEPDGVLSILTFPLMAGGNWYGFLRFDDCQSEKEWGVTEVGPLRSAVAAISLAIGRALAEEEKITLERRMLEGQKLESLGILAGGIAHDFNNLLTTIMGNANLAYDLLPVDSPVRQNLVSIDAATQRAADLAHQMLAYTGRGHLVRTCFDINETTHELMKLLGASFSKKVSLTCHLPETIPLVEGDPTQIRQVIMNLVINGAEAIGEESGTIHIRSGSETVKDEKNQPGPLLLSPEPGEYVTIEVTDSGCGMDEETIEKIFDPFFTTKVTGHGLGLAAVHGIIRSHGGGIRVRSMKGIGTTFVIYLPAKERPDISAVSHNQPDSVMGSGTILVADDEDDVRDLVESVLKKGGYRVITANDGIEALNLFKSLNGEIDAVILDLSMPNLSGTETLCQIRALSTTVPVILSSGFCEVDIAERHSENQSSGFIQKPYRPKALLNILSEVLNHKAS